ncbi:TIGR02594 family protein [Geomonas paludis]|uniref:TIGR02594 family protein n=1 Tax=Geomonas paludis TaxID=2740185 RepID=A0ABY4LBH9_9BACT|nr:TIGR02594 family protein [Geomonas paludis]UPU35262.1 TIGR02594 family protein [Geomonas paludis]
MTSNNKRSSLQHAPWLDIARQEVGQKEVVGHEDNPRILAYHATTTLKATDDETPWCSSFVNWCLKQAGIKGTDSAAAKSWVHWGMPSGPVPGAITVICSSKATDRSFSTSGAHVGFLIQETATHFKLLGGNQSNTVKEWSFPKKTWTLLGLRWPENSHE